MSLPLLVFPDLTGLSREAIVENYLGSHREQPTAREQHRSHSIGSVGRRA